MLPIGPFGEVSLWASSSSCISVFFVMLFLILCKMFPWVLQGILTNYWPRVDSCAASHFSWWLTKIGDLKLLVGSWRESSLVGFRHKSWDLLLSSNQVVRYPSSYCPEIKKNDRCKKKCSACGHLVCMGWSYFFISMYMSWFLRRLRIKNK